MITHHPASSISDSSMTGAHITRLFLLTCSRADSYDQSCQMPCDIN